MFELEKELQTLSEAEVLAALIDQNPDNRIIASVNRLAELYKSKFLSELEKRGYIPPHLLHVKARWPIEAVAIRRAKIEVTEDMSA